MELYSDKMTVTNSGGALPDQCSEIQLPGIKIVKRSEVETQMNDDVLKDYIRWRGDLSFENASFNEVDSAVLCELCYVDFSSVLEPLSSKGLSLRSAYRKLVEQNSYRLLTALGGQQDFVEAAADSKRFGNIRIVYYSDIFDKDKLQFSAMHFELDDTTSFIAFRGTDNSLIGWKEDFMMTFTHIPSQDMAVEYLRKTMRPDRNYYIGGHSKGGNLAVYAATNLDEGMKKHILRVYALDAPGFAPDVFNMDILSSLDHLLTCIGPQYGVVGNLFPREIRDSRIVASIQDTVLQHDLVSWKVNGPSFS